MAACRAPDARTVKNGQLPWGMAPAGSLGRTARRAATFTKSLPLLFRQLLVFLPALVQLFVFLRRKPLQAPVTFKRLLPLLRCQRHPLVHALLDSLLALWRQVGVARCEVDPAFAALRLESVPILLQRSEDGFLLGRQARPRRGRRVGDSGLWRDPAEK